MKPTNRPLISVLLPVHNAGIFLDACLSSIISQTYTNWELIAVDDASTDFSLEILKKYSALDNRIKVLTNRQNLGISASLNRALNRAKGQFIARMDADDISFSSRFKQQLTFLQTHPQVVVVGGQCQLIDILSRKIGHKYFPLKHSEIYQLAFNRSPVQHPAIMINTKLIPADFSWYKTDKIPAEDLDLYFRLFRYGHFANLKHTVIKYRIHSGNTTFHKPIKTYRMAQQIRKDAITHGYSPNIQSRLINLAIWLTFQVLPYSTIQKIYELVINTQSFKSRIKHRLYPSTAILAKVS